MQLHKDVVVMLRETRKSDLINAALKDLTRKIKEIMISNFVEYSCRNAKIFSIIEPSEGQLDLT